MTIDQTTTKIITAVKNGKVRHSDIMISLGKTDSSKFPQDLDETDLCDDIADLVHQYSNQKQGGLINWVYNRLTGPVDTAVAVTASLAGAALGAHYGILKTFAESVLSKHITNVRDFVYFCLDKYKIELGFSEMIQASKDALMATPYIMGYMLAGAALGYTGYRLGKWFIKNRYNSRCLKNDSRTIVDKYNLATPQLLASEQSSHVSLPQRLASRTR